MVTNDIETKIIEFLKDHTDELRRTCPPPRSLGPARSSPRRLPPRGARPARPRPGATPPPSSPGARRDLGERRR